MNYYFKQTYGKKVAKIPLNAGFTCPNRDGTKGTGGCTFCSSKGSGDSILAFNDDLQTQYELGLERMRKKWPDCDGFAYFQSYSNTYASLAQIKKMYTPFFTNIDCIGVSIATRPDCLTEEIVAYFIEMSQYKDVWIELGLQSVHEETMVACNRCHQTSDVFYWTKRLQDTPIHTCVHLMNSLPNESHEDMLESARMVGTCGCDAIKIHMLHLIQGTTMAKQYQEHPFHLLSLDEYVSIVVDQLEVLPTNCIIERLTGDGMADDLIAPKWTIKKTIVMNEIDKEMVRRDTWQGKKYIEI